MKVLVDDEGNAYNISPEVLATPPDGGEVKYLYDRKTGEEFALPAALFDDPAPDPEPGGNAVDSSIFTPTPGYQEKLIEILLERCTLTSPTERKRFELLISPILAIGKITSRDEFHIVMMEIENLIRSLYLSNVITEHDAVYVLDQIETFARWQARRSITFDGKPNEREWWTIQSIHKKTEITGEQPGSGGIIATVGRAFGKGRY